MESDSSAPPARLTRGRLPAYRYLPGQSPHPRRDPRGHSYGFPEPREQAVTGDQWRASETYLRGVDLLNEGFFWESHEAFEALWRAVDPGPVRELLQALIQIAAAEIKHVTAMPEASQRLASNALGRLALVPDRLLGLRVRDLERDVRERSTGTRPLPVFLRVEV